MTNYKYCYLFLTCKNTVEAGMITKALLEKRLVSCVKQLPVESHAWWKGKIEHTSEVLLVMEGALELFDKVEAEVAKLHSYDTFVLEAVPVAAVSGDASKWMSETLRS